MPRTTRPRTDGRDTRWAEHRLTRRAALVESTLKAIRRHGAGVGMDEIAAEAATSKTVLYRHFGDKAGLYLAVVAAVDELILHDLGNALGATDASAPAGAGAPPLGESPRSLVSAVVDGYLRLVERDPEVYRFVVTRPLLDRPVADDPVAGLTTRIGDQVATLLAARLRGQGQDPTPAPTWAHSLVGLVRAAADHWVSQPDPVPRPELVRQVTALAWCGLGGVLDAPTRPSAAEEH
jgi:AcrR family transcriptional regulator